MLRALSLAGLVLSGAGCTALLYLPPEKQPTPEAVRLVTDDLPRFYDAFDRAVAEADAGPLDPKVFERHYLRQGTPGLQAFDALAIGGAEQLAAAVSSQRQYYDAVRGNVLAVHTSPVVRDSVRAVLERLDAIYPDASFPDVFFVVGRLRTGGTLSSRGLLIGVELFVRDSVTPTTELSPWQQVNTRSFDALPHIVAHEAVHAQQRLRTLMRRSRLARALVEGGADFVASLASGQTLSPATHAYGIRHETEVWRDFEDGMEGDDLTGWFYGVPSDPLRPSDLGYFVGYRIAQAYYDRIPDKRVALREIVRLRDPAALLRESGYAERFE